MLHCKTEDVQKLKQTATIEPKSTLQGRKSTVLLLEYETA